jgi:hypothetical protein
MIKHHVLHGDLDEEIYMEQPEGFVQDHKKKKLFANSRSHCMA